MSGPRIVFLPDYGPAVGGGHVMRSLTLAGALSRHGARCAFAVSDETAKLVATFGAGGVDIWPLDGWPEGADIAVVDNYALTAEDERRLAMRGLRVVALDDLGRDHDCDLVIDPGFGRTEADYSGPAKVLAGPHYALLRPEFADLREAALTRRGGEVVSRLLVSLGLTDVGGITRSVVALLVDKPGWDRMDVVLGAGSVSLEYVREIAAHDPRVTVHVDTPHMATLTAEADAAIGAGGSSVWERACLGLPTLLITLAENQRPMAALLETAGAIQVIEAEAPDFETAFPTAARTLLTDNLARAALSATSAALCDGLGAERVAQAVLALAAESQPPSP